MRRLLIAMVVVGLVVGSIRFHPALAQTEPEPLASPAASTEENPAASFGWGMAAVGTNLLYIPAKMIYAITGGLVGLLAWGVTLGNNDVGLGVLQPAVTGTWVVTPEMLRGDQPIMFLGPSYEPAKDH